MTCDALSFENNVSASDAIDVIIELNYAEEECDCLKDITADSSEADIREAKEKHRNENKTRNLLRNVQFLEDNNMSLDSTEYTVVVGQYSPFIQLSFDNYEKYTECGDLVLLSAECDEVNEISITVPFDAISSATRVSSIDAPDYQMEQVLIDINATSQTYDGSGIKVGIIEAGGVATSNSHPELADLTIATLESSIENNHAVNVTRVLCGDNGVAKGVENVYIYHSGDRSSMVSAFDWLLENECSVVNISKSSTDVSGQYHWTSALLDYQVQYNFLSIICSAGNSGNGSNDISNYGMGYNVVTVGATDANNNVSTYSSYGLNYGVDARKPTLVAPGTNIIIGGDDIGSGTSYSAPIVSGIVAKLMEEFPIIQIYPEIAIAALIASASPVNGQSTEWDSMSGAGRVNYEKARTAVNNRLEFHALNAVYTYTFNLSVQKNTNIKIAAVWSRVSHTINENSGIVLEPLIDFDLVLKDMNGNILATSNGQQNIEYIYYVNNVYTTLVLCIQQNTAVTTGNSQWGCATWTYD